jgi:hypothetical protein
MFLVSHGKTIAKTLVSYKCKILNCLKFLTEMRHDLPPSEIGLRDSHYINSG